MANGVIKNYEQWRLAAIQKAASQGMTALLPQPGFQYKFMNSPADIVLGGGSAGGGKTYALLMEAARHRNNDAVNLEHMM